MSGAGAVQAPITFGAFVQKYYEPNHLSAKRPRTRARERSIINTHLAKLNGDVIIRVSEDQIQQLLAGWGYYLQCGILSTAVSIFEAARVEGLFGEGDTLPTDAVYITAERPAPSRLLTLADIRAAYEELPTPLNNLVLLVSLGPAIREALGARLKRYNFSAALATVDGKALQPFSLSIVEIWDSKNGHGRPRRVSVNKKRIIPLAEIFCDRAPAEIEKRRKGVGGDDFLFVSRGGRTKGQPYNSDNLREFRLKPVEQKRGIELNWMRLWKSGAALTGMLGLNAAERAWLYGVHLGPIAASRGDAINEDHVRDVVNQLAECIVLGKEPRRASSVAVQVMEQAPAAKVRDTGGGIAVPPAAGKSRRDRFEEFKKLNKCWGMDIWRSAEVNKSDGYGWVKNDPDMPDASKMSQRIEEVLKGERRLRRGVKEARAHKAAI